MPQDPGTRRCCMIGSANNRDKAVRRLMPAPPRLAARGQRNRSRGRARPDRYRQPTLAIRLTSRGPVLFRQRRMGRTAKSSTSTKFRTMVKDADRMLAKLTALNEIDGLHGLSPRCGDGGRRGTALNP